MKKKKLRLKKKIAKYSNKNINFDYLFTESLNWSKRLTKEEKRCIRKYTQNSLENNEINAEKKFFYRLNYYLRHKKDTQNIPNDEALEYYSIQISSAIGKFDLKKDTLCYRSDKNNILHNYEIGDVFEPGNFLSTSITATGTLKGNFKITILAFVGTKCAFIGPISRHRNQKEVLFDKSVKYKIILKEGSRTFLEVIK